jgi:predicted RNA binding protein YcfA (HicA-like mRNA interferase family)
MRLPRDLSGRDLAKALGKLGYEIVRQTGSHVCLTTQRNGQHHITIPDHDRLRAGAGARAFSRLAHPLQLSQPDQPTAARSRSERPERLRG